MKKKLDINGRARNILTILIIVCIGFVLASAAARGVPSPVRNAAGYVITPFQKGVSKAGAWLTDRLSGFADARELSRENEELKKQVSDLTLKNNELLQDQESLKRLEALYELDKKYSEYNKVAAQVISKDPGNWYSTFVVDKGSDDGIKENMNVMGQGGLIGIVTEVGAGWAQIRAIIDDESNISCMAQNTSEPCVVTGNLLGMDSGKIDFKALRDDDNLVTEGAVIVTSNISDRYLPGLLVGYVSEIELDSNSLTKSGRIIPAADFRSLREVLIITDMKQTRENS